MKKEVKQTHFTTRLYWENVSGGTVTVTLQINNGAIREFSKTGVTLEEAEKAGELLLNKLKALYV